jgi:hypothetical protein
LSILTIRLEAQRPREIRKMKKRKALGQGGAEKKDFMSFA